MTVAALLIIIYKMINIGNSDSKALRELYDELEKALRPCMSIDLDDSRLNELRSAGECALKLFLIPSIAGLAKKYSAVSSCQAVVAKIANAKTTDRNFSGASEISDALDGLADLVNGAPYAELKRSPQLKEYIRHHILDRFYEKSTIMRDDSRQIIDARQDAADSLNSMLQASKYKDLFKRYSILWFIRDYAGLSTDLTDYEGESSWFMLLGLVDALRDMAEKKIFIDEADLSNMRALINEIDKIISNPVLNRVRDGMSADDIARSESEIEFWIDFHVNVSPCGLL